MCGGDNQVQQRIVGSIDADAIHPWRRYHDITGGHVCHAQDAFEHDPRFRPDHIVVFRVCKGFDQFITGVGTRMDEFGKLLEKAALVFPFNGKALRMRIGHCGRRS